MEHEPLPQLVSTEHSIISQVNSNKTPTSLFNDNILLFETISFEEIHNYNHKSMVPFLITPMSPISLRFSILHELISIHSFASYPFLMLVVKILTGQVSQLRMQLLWSNEVIVLIQKNHFLHKNIGSKDYSSTMMEQHQIDFCQYQMSETISTQPFLHSSFHTIWECNY